MKMSDRFEVLSEVEIVRNIGGKYKNCDLNDEKRES